MNFMTLKECTHNRPFNSVIESIGCCRVESNKGMKDDFGNSCTKVLISECPSFLKS